MAQSLFTTTSLLAASSAPIYVKTGFVPGRIELINLTKAAGGVATNGYKSVWVNGMASGTALSTIFSATPADVTAWVATNGITLVNTTPPLSGQYGAVITGFTNANPGVITVDSTYTANITAGDIIRVAALADDQSGTKSLNGTYTVASVTATTITLTTLTTVAGGFSVYISGGYVTVLQTAVPTSPNPPYNVYSNVPTFYNEAFMGFIIGTSVFANATYSLTVPDLISVSCWDFMQP